MVVLQIHKPFGKIVWKKTFLKEDRLSSIRREAPLSAPKDSITGEPQIFCLFSFCKLRLGEEASDLVRL